MITSLGLSHLILLVGAGILALLLARKQIPARYAAWTTAGLVAVTLLVLLLGPRDYGDGPLWEITVWSSLPNLTPPLALQVSRAGRLLGSALSAAVLSTILVQLKLSESEESENTSSYPWVLTLVTLAAGLLPLIAANLLTLALSWAVMDSVSAAAWLLSSDKNDGQRQREALLAWGAGAASTLLLWATVIPTQASLVSQTDALLELGAGWMSTALVLAALLRLAPFPFHLLRPKAEAKEGAVFTLELTRQLIPLAAGTWLLAQVTGWEDIPNLTLQVLSALLLTGLVGSGLLAWLPSKDQRAVRWILSGQAGMVVLAGMWAGPEAALAEGMVLILVGTLLTLYTGLEHSSVESKIAAGLGLIALAGLPLTWGGDGRLPLFQAWLDGGWGLYLFLVAGAFLLLLGAAGRSLLQPISTPADQRQRVLYGTALGLLALGLLLRGGPIPTGGLVSWLALLLPLVIGALLAWEADSLRTLQQEMEPWLGPVLSLDWLQQLVSQLGGTAGRSLDAIHTVLEGEGALLWVLVVLALGWLLVS